MMDGTVWSLSKVTSIGSPGADSNDLLLLQRPLALPFFLCLYTLYIVLCKGVGQRNRFLICGSICGSIPGS